MYVLSVNDVFVDVDNQTMWVGCGISLLYQKSTRKIKN